ncbi:MAG: sigma-54 dependent transcriptional regulator [bacterium]|nr:sigma-54 dependent transcriptional regulator [bacterium]
MESVLIVDDEESIRKALSILLKRNGFRPEEARDGEEAMRKIDASCYDLVIADLNMPVMGGIDLLKRVKEGPGDTEVIILTAFGTIQSAVEAIKLGAYDYLTKPIEPKDIMIRVRNAVERKRLRTEVRQLRMALKDTFSRRHIVGRSPGILRLHEFIEQVAMTDSTVLVCGESGTGKELVARAIHGGGRRREMPFIPINCGALPEGLLEGELFGYVKGAFTGAINAKKGLFEEADRGTIFLDEISATSPMTQVRLLRVLQEQEIRRLGSNDTIKIDVRVIAATNQDLVKLVGEGKFREDLYYRLNVISVEIPPLRERKEDIPLLIDHLLRRTGSSGKKDADPKRVSAEAMRIMYEYHWPGNVRELHNAVERAVVLSKSAMVQADDLPPSIRKSVAGDSPGLRARGSFRDIEREYLASALDENGWNYSKTAKAVGIARNTLLRRIREYELAKPVAKTP